MLVQVQTPSSRNQTISPLKPGLGFHLSWTPLARGGAGAAARHSEEGFGHSRLVTFKLAQASTHKQQQHLSLVVQLPDLQRENALLGGRGAILAHANTHRSKVDRQLAIERNHGRHRPQNEWSAFCHDLGGQEGALQNIIRFFPAFECQKMRDVDDVPMLVCSMQWQTAKHDKGTTLSQPMEECCSFGPEQRPLVTKLHNGKWPFVSKNAHLVHASGGVGLGPLKQRISSLRSSKPVNTDRSSGSQGLLTACFINPCPQAPSSQRDPAPPPTASQLRRRRALAPRDETPEAEQKEEQKCE